MTDIEHQEREKPTPKQEYDAWRAAKRKADMARENRWEAEQRAQQSLVETSALFMECLREWLEGRASIRVESRPAVEGWGPTQYVTFERPESTT